MDVAFTYIVVAICFALLAALGLREKRSSNDGLTFRYQRVVTIAVGAGAAIWLLGAILIPLVALFHNQKIGMTLLSAGVYVVVNLAIVGSYIYGYLWFRSYSLRIDDNLVITTMRGTASIQFDEIRKAEIIDGKTSSRMVLFLRGGKKLTISGFLVGSNIAFDKIANKLMANGECEVRKRSYVGKWATIQQPRSEQKGRW